MVVVVVIRSLYSVCILVNMELTIFLNEKKQQQGKLHFCYCSLYKFHEQEARATRLFAPVFLLFPYSTSLIRATRVHFIKELGELQLQVAMNSEL